MGTIPDEAATATETEATSNPIPNHNHNRNYPFLERFLRDDGSICLGFLLLVIGIQQGIRYLKIIRQRPMSSTTSSPESSSGLSSMGSIVEETNKSSRVPLSRAIFWVALVSVLGFFWGQQLSFSNNAKADSETSNTQKIDKVTSSPTTIESKFKSESALLQGYLKEHEEKKISLPRFDATDETSKAVELERRKHFAEFIVHPILLVSGNEESPDDPPDAIAIAVNFDSYHGIELAQDLLKEIVRHKDVLDVMVLLVKSGCCEDHYEDRCPTQLTHGELFDHDDAHNIGIECVYIDPSWGHQEESRDALGERLSDAVDDDFDVSIVLSGCDSDDIKDRIWEKALYESTLSMVSTCTGPQRPHGRSLTSIGINEQQHRIDRIYKFFNDGYDENNVSKSLYTQIVDYDVQGLNMAVAFHKDMDDGTYRWHLNEANHNVELAWRLMHGSRDENNLRYFEAADMTRLQFPSKQSASSLCSYLEDYDEMEEDDKYFCDYGYDPYVTNIPIDKIYVGQSTSGENAGRGVFTSVDLLEIGMMVGLETSVQSVSYPPVSKAIVTAVTDMKVYNSYDDILVIGENEEDDDDDDKLLDDFFGGDSVLLTTGLHRSPSAYAEAYGFDDEPWGIPQTSVFTNILTFTNHGCNGTANLGHNVPGLNEFTMEPESPGFTIPDDFKQFSAGEYSPHRDRSYLGSINIAQVEHPILKGEELFDNYIGFGGDAGFVEQVIELKRDCLGALGTVEMHQLHLQKKKNQKEHTQDSKSDPLHNKRRRSKDTKKGDSDDDDGKPKETESKEDDSEEEDDGDDGSAGSDEL